ncbi:hypothetical protein ACMGD3_10905 [Lysinibacillus sphaericus]|uniref:hypothetical protein n=1 Tax=Lysinibacillus sphaericus TaxID=1421 RepID=UPI001C5EB140
MLKMILIGLFFGEARIFMQRQQLAKLSFAEKVQTPLVYSIGIGALLGIGSFVMK